ncbi:YihY/virulence factor BrkB family protein [Deinococcus sp. YIM 77859]|uniref:YihY/virulence factor BrkB family protein n=1 Tax=Deinococcus sp. YIM 77859 TaxID=1540221 RepID=UPI000551F4F9|nr:YihY/virulence factor BrkB family protein [Deinococcus sp. YIM 77859]
MRFTDLFTLIREAALAFGQDKAPRLAAAIAYYAIFSLAPLLLFAVAVAGFFLTNDAVITTLFGPQGLVAQNLGEKAAEFLRSLVQNQEGIQRGSLWATVIAFVTLFMGATGLFVQLQDALSSMWGADPPPPGGFLKVAQTRVVSFLLILGIGLVLLAFLALNTYLSAIAQRLGDVIGAGAFFVRVGTVLLGSALLTLVFAAIYKFLPAVKLQWHEVWVGSAVTAVLFTLGQVAIGFYLGRSATSSVFGVAGTLVALLLWIYYSGMIFFFGAEVTWVYSQKYGTHAGGAANVSKKAAVAAKGAEIDPTPSGQEAAALQHADRAPRDARGRVHLPWLRRAPAQDRTFHVQTSTPQDVVPGIGQTLWNAVTAVLAIPAVIVLRLLGWKGRKQVRRK